jgi:hypothetical protein
MTNAALPRRRLLAAALALPAASVAIALPAVAAADPDAELLALGHQHAASLARYDALNDQCEAAYEAAIARSPTPDVLCMRKGDHPIVNVGWDGRFAGDIMDSEDVRRWRINSDMACILWPPRRREELLTRRAEILAAWEVWGNEREAANVACGVRALEHRLDAEGQALTDLEHRIFALRATTPAGWRLKATLAKRLIVDWSPEGEGTYEDHVVRSLLADLTCDAGPVSVIAS